MTKNEIIDQCIKEVESLIRPRCDDHTPYWGKCISCGSVSNYDILPDPDDVIKALKDLKDDKE